ncbi:MAG: hypothetical protein H0X31_07780 [Nostocaceae cyanobacterium]|nr:hypothetical protein [Nostocaceae cyanobacterium]
MNEEFEDYTNVLNQLVSEAIACSPESWIKGKLTITCDGFAINYALKNEDVMEKADISDSLRST